MNDYKKEMDKLNDNKKSGKPVDKPKKCMYQNCEMLAATTAEGRNRCAFHQTGDYHHEVTVSIKQNKNFINGYNNMVKWDVSDWAKHNNYLLNNKNCPIEQGELPSMYLVRFFNWISEKIANDASVLIEKRGVEQ